MIMPHEDSLKSDNQKKLYVIITCDTEDKNSSIPYLYECDFGERGNCGVHYIMDQLEKHSMRGVFFTNIYEHKNFTGNYEFYLENLIREMTQRGHEVGLHFHYHGSSLDYYNKLISSYDYSTQRKIIEYGIDFIEKNTGVRPVSARGGAYDCNEVTFKVLEDLGIKVDSSCFYAHTGVGNQFHHFRSLNQVVNINNIIEFPIVNMYNDRGKPKKFDINQLSLRELTYFINHMKERDDFNAVQFMFHSFSFIQQSASDTEEPIFISGSHKAYGIHNGLIERFEKFIDLLQKDPDIELITFNQYINMNLPLPSIFGDGIFHTDTPESISSYKEFKGKRINFRCNIKDSFVENNVDRSILDFTYEIPYPKFYFNDNVIDKYARDLISGQLIVYGRIESMPWNLDTFDWNTEWSNIPRTFQLYLHALNPIQILVRAFEKGENANYMKFAWDMVKKWKNYAYSDESRNNQFVWGDHATSLRTENLLYFAQQCEISGFWSDELYSELYDILCKHGEFLNDDIHYTDNHNHGIMQDQALLHLGTVLRRDDWVEHSINRLKKQLLNAFNDEKIPTENSPGYTFLVPGLFKKIGEFLNDIGRDGDIFIEYSSESENFRHWCMMPNGMLAQKGDTSNMPGKLYGKESDMKKVLPECSALYPHAGYYFYRSDTNDIACLDTWAMFASGYCNTTHKHADDSSFILYSKGYEIFSDSGIYGYQSDEFRKYFVSAMAHNCVIVDGKSYICNKDNRKKVGFIDGIISDNYDHIMSFKDVYEDVHLERDFCLCGDAIIIFDSSSSQTSHTYSQLFHLGENIAVIEKSFNEVLLSLADSGFIVRIHQYGDDGNINVIVGDMDKPGFGLISRGEGHRDVTTTLKFDISGIDGKFITLITIEDSRGYVRLKNNEISHKKYFLWNSDKKSFLIGEKHPFEIGMRTGK